MAENLPNWDFNCPQFVDFSANAHESNDGADDWFDRGTNVAIPSLQTMVSASELSLPQLVQQKQVPKARGSPAVSPCMTLFNRKLSEKITPVGKRLCMSLAGSSAASNSLCKPKRSLSRASLLLHNARKTIRNRLMSNNKAAACLKTRLVQRNPMAPICLNTGDELKQTEEGKRVDFVASLRRYDPPINGGAKLRSTLPVPFKFSHPISNKPLKRSPFRSLSEQVIAFEKRTPPRFRTQKAATSVSSSGGRMKLKGFRRIGTPRLLCKERNRPVNVQSFAQQEQLELDEMKKSQFHAKPANNAILKEMCKLPTVEKRPTTVCEPFNIGVDGHGGEALSAKASVANVPKIEFAALPIPPGLFNSPKLKAVRTIPLTVAQSPSLLLKSRAILRERQDERRPKEEPEIKEKMARPFVNVEPFVPKLERKVTEVEPFNFDERDKDRQKLKEQKIREILDEEKQQREFYAQPMPAPNVSGLPSKAAPRTTTVKPFHLQADERGVRKQSKWMEQMEQESIKQKEQSRFKAQPCTVTSENPFVPQKTNKPPTTTTRIELQTEKRAKEREVFEASLRTKDAEVEEARRLANAQKDEEERQLIASLRSSTVHLAQPVRHYTEVHVTSSILLPTDPMTPNLATTKRKRT